MKNIKVSKEDLRNLAVLGDNRNLLITNWELDDITFDQYPYSAIIRLYEPLPSDIQLKDKFHLVREITPPVIEQVFLESIGGDDEGNLLRPPNFDVDDKHYIRMSVHDTNDRFIKEKGLKKKFFKHKICTIHAFCRSKLIKN